MEDLTNKVAEVTEIQRKPKRDWLEASKKAAAPSEKRPTKKITWRASRNHKYRQNRKKDQLYMQELSVFET